MAEILKNYENSENKSSKIYEEYKKNGIYEVKKGDTLFSILKSIPEAKDFLSLTNHPNFPENIKAGDKVSFELQDKNSAELTINNKTYILNLSNNEVIDTNREVQNNLDSIQKAIYENLENRDNTIKKVHFLLAESTKSELPDGFYDDITILENKLLGPQYKNNPEAERALKVLKILNLDGSISKEKAFQQICSVLDDTKIGLLEKHRLVKFLNQHYLGYMTEGNEKIGYISDPMKGVDLGNMLTKKYHKKYNFENFQMIADPEGGSVYTNNF